MASRPESALEAAWSEPQRSPTPMENVLLVLTLLSCLALIVAVLLQRSEGGALGMGGGGGGGLMSGRGAANSLVHGTMFLAAIFFVSCLALTRLANEKAQDSSDVIRAQEELAADPFKDSFNEGASEEVAEPAEDFAIENDLFSTPADVASETPTDDVGEIDTPDVQE